MMILVLAHSLSDFSDELALSNAFQDGCEPDINKYRLFRLKTVRTLGLTHQSQKAIQEFTGFELVT